MRRCDNSSANYSVLRIRQVSGRCSVMYARFDTPRFLQPADADTKSAEFNPFQQNRLLVDEIKHYQALSGQCSAGDIVSGHAACRSSSRTRDSALSSPHSESTSTHFRTTSEVAGSCNSSLLRSPPPGNDEPGEQKASSQDRAVSTNEASLPPGVLAQLHSLSGHALSSSRQLHWDSSASKDAIAGIFSLPVFAAPTFSGGGSSSITTAGVSYGSGVVDDGKQASASTPPCGESSGTSRYRDHEGCPAEDRGMNGCSMRGGEGHWGSLALEDQMQSLMSDMDKAMSRFRVDSTGARSDDMPTVTCLSHLPRHPAIAYILLSPVGSV